MTKDEFARLTKGLARKEIAARLQITPQHVGYLLNGRRKFTPVMSRVIQLEFKGAK